MYRLSPIILVLQKDVEQCMIGRIVDKAAWENKRVYKQMYLKMIKYNGKKLMTANDGQVVLLLLLILNYATIYLLTL